VNESVIHTEHPHKVYRMGEVEVSAPQGVSFDIRRGEMLSIVGPAEEESA